MPTGKPVPPVPPQPAPLLKDLPAQPVDEKEAEGIKGGASAEMDGGELGAIARESPKPRGTP